MMTKLKSFPELLRRMYVFYGRANSKAEPSVRWGMELERRLASELYLERYGFKAYSQNEEDGVISEIFARIGTTNKTFIEFGVQDGLECNTHLLLHMGWKGLWIDGSEESCRAIQAKFRYVIESGQLKAVNSFITRENINDIFTENGFSGEIDLLSIDIDGNDYHIFKVINAVNPRVIIVEYNAKFPPSCLWIMPYDAKHVWDSSDKHGASLKAFEELGTKKGYRLVGTERNGVNAFFVREDLAKNLFASPPTAENLYNPFGGKLFIGGHPSKEFLPSDGE
jgi:hypothetical protein